jgi:hypothetical protein
MGHAHERHAYNCVQVQETNELRNESPIPSDDSSFSSRLSVNDPSAHIFTHLYAPLLPERHGSLTIVCPAATSHCCQPYTTGSKAKESKICSERIPRCRLGSLAPKFLQRLPFSSAYHSPAPATLQCLPLQRLPFSSAYHSPATAILQRLPLSSAYHSSDYHSLAPAILQRLPFSSACHSPAPAILQRLHFSGHHISLAPTF